jgi:hypothetical protein
LDKVQWQHVVYYASQEEQKHWAFPLELLKIEKKRFLLMNRKYTWIILSHFLFEW